MKTWEQAVLNALIMAGLSAIPIWVAYETIDYTMVKAVCGTFLLTFLTLSARYFRPPKTDLNNDAIEDNIGHNQPKGKKLIGQALSVMWVG